MFRKFEGVYSYDKTKKCYCFELSKIEKYTNHPNLVTDATHLQHNIWSSSLQKIKVQHSQRPKTIILIFILLSFILDPFICRGDITC